MISNMVIFLIQTSLNLLTGLLLLRFAMQWLSVSFQNPVGQFCIALTDFIVKPTRRWVKHYKRLDLSTLLLAFIAQVLLQFALRTIIHNPSISLGELPLFNLVFLGIFGVMKQLLDVFFYAILLQAILSWVNPHTPISGVLDGLSRPILKPIQENLPPIQGFDLSSLVALILLQMINLAIIPSVESYFNSNFY